MYRTTAIAGTLALLLPAASALAQDQAPPKRVIPHSVLVDVANVEGRFDLALAADCAPDACFSKGCAYVAHSTADRPVAASLPGLSDEAGPDQREAQYWLTQARCAFAYDSTVEPEYASALARRLQTKASSGFTAVSVSAQALTPLPEPLAEPELAPEPPPPAPAEEPWTAASAAHELWDRLLQDIGWLAGLLLATLAAIALIWAWRRVGRETFEERAMLAELERGLPEESDLTEESTDDGVAAARAGWSRRLEGPPDVALQAMLRDLLRAGELPLLAKAVLTFPDALPAAFPSGGDLAGPKLALASYLKSVDPTDLPSDAALFAALDRHASAATLSAQQDAEVVRALREEFGVAGLVGLIDAVSPRTGGLLFALSPPESQVEATRLLTPDRLISIADQLLQSDRMDGHEAEHLFELVRAVRDGAPAPPAPARAGVSDRGRPFDAAAALSALLPALAPSARGPVLGRALERFGGSLPSWTHEIVLPDLLLALADGDRADLLLGVPLDALAAWLSAWPQATTDRLLSGAPAALVAGVSSAAAAPSRAAQLARADVGRRAIAAGLREHLARTRTPFEDLVRALPGATA